MNIAVANSRKSKTWKNIEVTWNEFMKLADNPRNTTESMEEYRKMTKRQQDEIKDVGGFVGARLIDGMRRGSNVEFRSLLTLDMDYAPVDFWETFESLFDYRACVYSTHRSTPDKPRLRLIMPLARNVSSDEYVAVARMIAKDIGIEFFDDLTYQPQRLMYWSSTCCDGEYIFKSQDGKPVEPDEILARYKNWRDVSEYPISSRQSTVVKREITKLADPLAKEGLVGAFCRRYSVEDAIEKFLGGIYEPSETVGRYDFVEADSTAGVVIYDGKFAFSHHATDPANGKLLNSFDLVRIHKFGDDEKSSKEMLAFCAADDEVKLQLGREREEQAQVEFSEGDWQKQLELQKDGEIKDTLSNIILIIKHDPNLIGVAYNQHSNCIDVRDKLPWKQVKEGWNDADIAGAKAYIDSVYRLWSPGKFKDALLAVAAQRAYHPVKEYFESLPAWDEVERLDTLLIVYLGAEDSSYVRAVMRKVICAAVARIYEPGIKFDYILVLNGPQGIGKSTFFSKIGGKWFSDSLSISDMRDKTAPEKLQGNLILELGELAGLKKMDVETVKSFVTRTDDKYRQSFGVVVESHPRQCIIVGSTNSESGFLRDITGNRRFWPVYVSGRGSKMPWEMTDIDQIWSEALHRYRAGEELKLSKADEDVAFCEQSRAIESDEREGLVREYLEKLLPDNWIAMDLYERRNFLCGSDFSSKGVGTIRRTRVCNLEIWCECFGRDQAHLKKTDSYELNGIMAKIEGWKRYEANKKGNIKFAIYGSQIAHVRVE